MPAAVHISLNVSDLSRSAEFYRRFLGKPKKWKNDYAKFVGEEPEIHLALQPGPIDGRGPLSHLGIRVDSIQRVLEWKNALNRRGIATEEQKRDVCCYALQEKFWVTDPDGNRWEVYTVLEDVEEGPDAAASCCQPATETEPAGSCCAG